jgi:hypothetical protein
MAFWRKDDKSKPADDPQAMVARREYDAAIKGYRALLVAKPGKYVFNHKIADVYCLAGRQGESMADYAKAADGYARDGYLIKAAAILKKMQKIEPENADVKRRLDSLGKLGSSTSVVEPHSGGFGAGSEISFDMEMIEEPASIPVSGLDEAAPPLPPPAAPPPRAIPVSGATSEPPSTAPASAAMTSTPLFSDFSPTELSDVLARLRHQSFDPGAIIVKEGDPGESLFVLSQGRVRVIGTGPGGKPVTLAELGEGDFFGEVALLTGKPRTATILCEEETEVLELTRSDLADLEGRHPRIRQVIESFYEQRVESTVESMLDAVRLPDPE